MDLKCILNQKISSLGAEIVFLDKTPMAGKQGYLSDIHFLTLHLTNSDDMQLVLKTPLKSPEGEWNEKFYDISQAVHMSELNFYEKIYPELEKAIKELHLPSPFPKCYYAGTTSDGPVIVLEDLTQRNLQMPNLQIELSESQLRMILRALAIVQVGSCWLQMRRKATLLEMFPFLKHAFFDNYKKVIPKNLELLRQHFLKEYPDSEKLLELASSIALDTGFNEYFFGGKDTDFILGHGDLWNHNIFMNDTECILIDWQLAGAGCANGDIATLVVFGSDLGQEPSKRFESLVRCYLNFMIECCGDNTELKAHVAQKVIPLLSSAKMIKLSLQFGVKWMICLWDSLTKSAIFSRIEKNLFYILKEMSE